MTFGNMKARALQFKNFTSSCSGGHLKVKINLSKITSYCFQFAADVFELYITNFMTKNLQFKTSAVIHR